MENPRSHRILKFNVKHITFMPEDSEIVGIGSLNDVIFVWVRTACHSTDPQRMGRKIWVKTTGKGFPESAKYIGNETILVKEEVLKGTNGKAEFVEVWKTFHIIDMGIATPEEIASFVYEREEYKKTHPISKLGD